jgi:hypothetical protein
LDLANDRPQEAHHLAGDRGDNDGVRLSCGSKPAITGAKPDLGLPSDVANDLGQFLIAVMQFAADARLHAIGPRPFDQRSPGKGVAGLGDAARRTVAPLECSG